MSNEETKNNYLKMPWLEYYSEGISKEVEIPQISVPELFDSVIDKFGNKTALIFYGKKIKFKKLKDLVDRFASALIDLGVKKGDTVGMHLLNSPQYIITYMAILKVGAKVTSISPVYTSHEVKHQITDSKANTIVCEDILYDNIGKANVKLENVILTSIIDFLPATKKKVVKKLLANSYKESTTFSDELIRDAGFKKFMDLVKKYPPLKENADIDPKNDLAVLAYTGGTTGLPKAAIITHYNIIAVVKQIQSVWPFMNEGKEVSIGFLPFFHIYGQVAVMLNSLTYGTTMVLFTTPDIDEILNAIERYRASVFAGVPTLYEHLKEYEKTNCVNWKRLKAIVCGADTLHESTVKDWERRTKSKILEGYGMTETTGVSHFSPFDRPKICSFGVPIPNVKAAIMDIDGNDFMPVGEVGEMILSGPNIMQGYWNRSEETEKTIIEIDGIKWLKTGDLVKMDEEGYFFFVDRKKDLIKYKGYSVFAKHVEEVLYKHPQIKAAGVVGVPEPTVGQLIKAYVVLQTEARGKVSEEDIKNFCKENMAHYKVPKIIEFRGELPKTDVGKVSRRELREELDEG